MDSYCKPVNNPIFDNSLLNSVKGPSYFSALQQLVVEFGLTELRYRLNPIPFFFSTE